ncbi:hypothetical protein ABN070_08870 [Morganella morganii]|uniref:hypothetical protein n=1 Tax=Morganella morganii TaxID=582 RepID=UPI0032DA948D
MMKNRLILVSVLLLSGCSSVWVEVPGGSEYTRAEANAFCEPESHKLYPVKNEVAQRSVMRDVEKRCKKDDDCGNSKTYKEQTPVTESYVMDVNEDSRNRYFYNCMKTKGWDREDRWMWE